MASRIKNTTTDALEQKEDTEKLTEILKNSNCPRKEIRQIIRTTLSTTKPETTTSKRKLKKLKIQLYFSYPNKLQKHLIKFNNRNQNKLSDLSSCV
jgi:hypothetical protein